MIEIFKYNSKYRIKIVNETLEFETEKDFVAKLIILLNLKESKEPYKKNDK